jgi:hypothetical protein
LVNELHGQEAIRQSDYDYNHLREFVRDLRREDYVRIERPSDKGPVSKRPLWIFPMVTPGASVLDTAVGGSVSADTKSDVEVVLGARRTLETAAVWGDVVGAFAGKRLGEQRADGGPERTRFNRVGVALRGRDRVGVAFDGALAAGSDHAVLVTATTDPARFESVAAAAEGLLGDVKALRKKLGRAVGESVLPGVVVPEPTARGVPHAHVPVFGAERASLPSKHDLHWFWWENKERGQQVDVKPLVADGGTWTWGGDGPADADGCPPRAYCQQGSSALATAAALAAEDLCAVASALRDRGDVVMDAETAAAVDAEVAAETGVDVGAVRDAAWYWATGLKAATRPSRSLRAAVDTRDAGGAADA